jgi:hypothetical protein
VTDFAHPDMIAHNRTRAAREEQAWAKVFQPATAGFNARTFRRLMLDEAVD